MVKQVSTSFVPREAMEAIPEIFAWNEHNTEDPDEVQAMEADVEEDVPCSPTRKGLRLL